MTALGSSLHCPIANSHHMLCSCSLLSLPCQPFPKCPIKRSRNPLLSASFILKREQMFEFPAKTVFHSFSFWPTSLGEPHSAAADLPRTCPARQTGQSIGPRPTTKGGPIKAGIARPVAGVRAGLRLLATHHASSGYEVERARP